MVRKIGFAIIIVFLLAGIEPANAQYSPEGKQFGFGIILGDPTGGTAKLWLNRENALAFHIGASSFGDPRIGVDYLWHFDAFNSDIANFYAGPGGAIGMDDGIGGRAMFGINIVPRRTPLEIFAELGVLIAFAPDYSSDPDAAVGVRFYP